LWVFSIIPTLRTHDYPHLISGKIAKQLSNVSNSFIPRHNTFIPVYGLIAEEVDKVLPELVFYKKEKEVIKGSTSNKMIHEGVHYENLPTLLLSELQKHQIIIEVQHDVINSLQLNNNLLQYEIDSLQPSIIILNYQLKT